MKNKGFTLVELLAIIIILGIVVAIVSRGVTQNIEDARLRSYNIVVKTIEDAAELYVGDYSNLYSELNTPGSTFNVTLQTVSNAGYLKTPIKDPRTDENISLTEFVRITVIAVGRIDVEFMDD